MAFSIQMYAMFLWIAGAVLPTTCQSCDIQDSYRGRIKSMFRDVCYEFAQESKPWSQANDACVKRGGQLLSVLSCEIKEFLRNFTMEVETEGQAWWVGESLMGQYEENTFNISTWKELETRSTAENGDSNGTDSSPPFCTYVIMDPFQLVTTHKCSMSLGYLCTLDVNPLTNQEKSTGASIPNTSQRLVKRSSSQSAQKTEELLNKMKGQLIDTEELLQTAVDLLEEMEQMQDDPTYEQRMQYLQYLLDVTQSLTPTPMETSNQNIILYQFLSAIVNCTGSMLLSTLTQCDKTINPSIQYETMFTLVFKIYVAVNLKKGMSENSTNETLIIKHSTATIYASRHVKEQLGSKIFKSEDDGPYFKFPSYSALQGQLQNVSFINVQLHSFSVNPLAADSNESISGAVCSLSIWSETSAIHLKDLSEQIKIFLPRPQAPKLQSTNVSLEEGAVAITSFNITDPDQTVTLTMKPSQNVSLLLFLAQGYQPNETNYQLHTILTSTENYRWLVTPEMHESVGTWNVNASLVNSTWTPGLKLLVSVFTTKCMFWDRDQTAWSTYGCLVSPDSEPELTQCLCNHLTFFGSSFFVIPNHVDLSRTAELFATVHKNYVVVVLLSSFFSLYLLTLLWACYADRRALRKRKMTLLEDNHPCANYNYLLNVQTGHRSGAGTSAKVTVMLLGTEGESEPHHLTDPDKPVFERGGVDMFLLTTPFFLGELQSIRLWHDNSGGHPAWYLNKVTVHDLQTRKLWHFLSSTWLTSTQGEGLTKRTFNSAKKHEIACFGNIFQTRTSTGFRDEHIWVSIVDPPRRSPFTRVQRVSCCMSLLLCTMAINIMFWNMPLDQKSPVILKIGSFELTWQEIMVAVESGLLMFPINILIITIFRSIKPRLTPPKEKHRTTQDQKTPAVTMQTILKDMEEMVHNLSKSPKNRVAALEKRLESQADLCSALDRVHEIIHIMQGEGEHDPHWVHCSQFVLYSLGHLSGLLESVGEKAFPSAEEHRQTQSTVTLLLKKAEMVSTSHIAQSPPPVSERKRKSGFWLPWWFVFLGWFLLLSISGVSTFFTLLYGFVYGKDSSTQWVITLALSLFQSIFVLQPLKVLGVAIFFALILKPVAAEESEEVELLLAEQQEKRALYSGRAEH